MNLNLLRDCMYFNVISQCPSSTATCFGTSFSNSYCILDGTKFPSINEIPAFIISKANFNVSLKAALQSAQMNFSSIINNKLHFL